jgi:hypothetical protein
MLLYFTTKCIVCCCIITKHSPKLSYNAIIFQDREKDSELLGSRVVCNWTKGKEGFSMLLLVISYISSDSKKKESI